LVGSREQCVLCSRAAKINTYMIQTQWDTPAGPIEVRRELTRAILRFHSRFLDCLESRPQTLKRVAIELREVARAFQGCVDQPIFTVMQRTIEMIVSTKTGQKTGGHTWTVAKSIRDGRTRRNHGRPRIDPHVRSRLRAALHNRLSPFGPIEPR
jgi:hypothetical protein